MSVAGEPLVVGATTATDEANFARFEEQQHTPVRRMQRALHRHPTIVPFVVLAFGILIFSAIVGARFLAPFNLSLILQQVTIVGMIGIAQTLVILTAGVDLSVGAIMILVTVVTGHLAVTSGVPTVFAVLIGLAIGMGCGAINGALVTFVRLPPFIVTLGTWSVYGAIFLWYSGSQTIRSQDVLAHAPFLQMTGTAWSFFGARFTFGTLVTVITAALMWYVLNRTAFGRHVYATGDDQEAARLAGIDTRRTVLAVYTLAGLICALGAWVLIGRIGAISPTSGGSANLDSITATVIGGTSLFGGRGSIVGTLVGALIVGVFRNGLALAGLDALWQEFAVGLLIIVAVALDQWIRRVSA
ncbi:ABC transporter permease [Lichenifustis flavocetrariae]|uniref:ABC transporter permease n=1 Tax=Lichenifustis flavocetrariae TaxID=2949735 RepID=A0AA42CPV2_9HYPH|nr:ABC transporter permease [Lichenifustis flavocetrariae]MCW6510790.1 ABC transporter permease [Lichenifustis flavocetrariae]